MVGNYHFKEKKYEEAISAYLKGLMGMDFSTCSEKVEFIRTKMVDLDKKVPVLNNIALCLQK